MKKKWNRLTVGMLSAFLLLGGSSVSSATVLAAQPAVMEVQAAETAAAGETASGEAGTEEAGEGDSKTTEFMSHMTIEKPVAEKKQIDEPTSTSSEARNTYVELAVGAIAAIFAVVIILMLVANLSRKRKRRTYNILMGIALAFLVVVTTVANVLTLGRYNLVMNKTFGKGEMKVTKAEGSESWDADYDKTTTSSKDEARAQGQQQTETEMEEGAVLLKNENEALPLQENAQRVTLFGVNSVYISAGAQGEDVSGQSGEFTTLQEGLEQAGISVNPSTIDLYKQLCQSDDYKYETKLTNTTDESMAVSTVYQYGHNSAGFSNQEPWIIGEVEPEKFTSDIEATYADYSDAAIVTLTRVGGEGSDLATDMGQFSDYGGEEGKHYLELDSTEQALIKYVKQHFSKVVVLINSSNVMELGDLAAEKTEDNLGVDAILWIGGVGGTGTKAVGRLLTGEVNPSGKTADIYPADLTKDPTWNNFGTYQYSNVDESNGPEAGAYLLDYEEDIYVGYRYYETAAAEAQAGNYDGFNYEEAVVFPFGYGLSYTTFDMAYDGTPTYQDGTFTFNVKVTNTGDAAGKEVAELYVETPYTYGGIEKSQVVLAGFAKTDLLEPGASQTVTITVDKDNLASYDYQNEKCYVLDQGSYQFYLSDDSHSWASIDSSNAGRYFAYDLDKEVFKDDNKRDSDLVAAVNQLDDVTNYHFVDYTDANADHGYAHNMTRQDFVGSFPTSPTADDLVAGQDVLDGINYDVTRDNDDSAQMPTTGENNGLQLIELRGKDYDDPMWDDLLDELTVEDMHSLCAYGHFETAEISSIGAPVTSDIDSPNGFVNFFKPDLVSNGYTTEPVLASTWNTEVAAGRGTAIGEEALQYGLNGWYGPGLNLHRSAFGGRNNEYFSEDPLLGGMMAAAECGAAESKGLMVYSKHYVCNNQEAHRNEVLCTFVNEQAARELYMRTFEVYGKNAVAHIVYLNDQGQQMTADMKGVGGVMTCYNMIGAIWGGGNKATIINILRDEWGIHGASITDAIGATNHYAVPDQAIRNGSNLLLAYDLQMSDTSSATAVNALRDATHHVLFSKVNSSAMNGIAPGTTITYSIAPWKVVLIACDIASAALVIIGIVLIVRRNRKEQAKV